jgi:cob(I)alamin adenosyltransferase
MTSLLGDTKVPKYHLQPEAFGTVDEASSALGLARASSQHREVQELILAVQRDLYRVMSELAATQEAAAQFETIDQARIAWLERETDKFGNRVKMPREFVVPGDTQVGALFDLARTMIRRAERVAVKLCDEGLCNNGAIVPYLNRLSSLCFVLARFEDQTAKPGSVTLAKGNEAP